MKILKITHKDTWIIRHEVMWPNKPIDYIKLENDSSGFHFGLYVGEKLVSVISVFINDRKAQFRKFATVEDFQNKGYGSKLLEYIISYFTHGNVDILWCNARIEKMEYYRKFGFDETDEQFIKDGKTYVIMKKKI